MDKEDLSRGSTPLGSNLSPFTNENIVDLVSKSDVDVGMMFD
jgi:hypothetical protein